MLYQLHPLILERVIRHANALFTPKSPRLTCQVVYHLVYHLGYVHIERVTSAFASNSHTQTQSFQTQLGIKPVSLE